MGLLGSAVLVNWGGVVEEKEIISENSTNPIHIFVVILIIVTGISQIRKN